MNIQHQENSHKGSFFVKENGKKIGELTYTYAGDTRFIIDHTEVGDAVRGEGLGQQMVDKAVTFAREKGLKIIPLCPFAKSVFDKNPEYQDVL